MDESNTKNSLLLKNEQSMSTIANATQKYSEQTNYLTWAAVPKFILLSGKYFFVNSISKKKEVGQKGRWRKVN